jgi:septal ring factor EnvC (AmiA/AmiB activator)
MAFKKKVEALKQETKKVESNLHVKQIESLKKDLSTQKSQVTSLKNQVKKLEALIESLQTSIDNMTSNKDSKDPRLNKVIKAATRNVNYKDFRNNIKHIE